MIAPQDVAGELRLTDRAFTVDGHHDEAVVATAVEATYLVREAVGHVAYSVRGVVCFTRDEDLAGWAGEVVVCTTTNLVPLLVSRRTILTPDQLDSAVVVIKESLSTRAPERRRRRGSVSRPSGHQALPPGLPGWAQGPAFRVPEPVVAVRHRRRGVAGLASLAAGLVLVSGTVAMWPQLSGAVTAPSAPQVAEDPRPDRACRSAVSSCDPPARKRSARAAPQR